MFNREERKNTSEETLWCVGKHFSEKLVGRAAVVSRGVSSARISVVRGRCVTARADSPRSRGSRTGTRARDESGKWQVSGAVNRRT